MDYFEHERLDVYKTAIAFVALSNALLEDLPKGRGHLGDPLERASTRIAFNIAEGAGGLASLEKARLYRIARRSATECAAILDVSHARTFVNDEKLNAGRAFLLRIVAMLTRMILNGTHKSSG